MNISHESYQETPPQSGPLADDQRWPEPGNLETQLYSTEPFTLEMLPTCLRDFALDVASRMQVPLEMPAVTLICALGGATGRRAKVQPKERDTGWQRVPNLWGGIVAPPGSMKSPVISACLSPLYTAEALNESNGLRLIVNDGTFESLHQLMSANPSGLFLVRDELTGMLEMLSKPGREGERQFYLEGWNASGQAFKLDRISRGTVVAQCCLSMFGGIQPDQLQKYIWTWLAKRTANDGFLDRFQLLIWPNISKDWNYVDKMPNAAAAQRVERIFQAVSRLSPDNPRIFRFSYEAQSFFVSWLTGLERTIREGRVDPILLAHLGKHRSLMPSLACLFCLAKIADEGFEGFEGRGDPLLIDLDSSQAAATWCTFLESHARKIYSCVIAGAEPAVILSKQILGQKLNLEFTPRDIKQKDWRGLKEDGAIEEGLKALLAANWLRALPSTRSLTGGRPTVRYQINPKLFSEISNN